MFIRVGKSSWIREKGNGLIVGHVSITVGNGFALVSNDYRGYASFCNAECAEYFQSHFVLVVVLVLTCVAGVQKGKGKELGRETAREGGRKRPARSRAPKFPPPLPLLTPATQAILVLESNVP